MFHHPPMKMKSSEMTLEEMEETFFEHAAELVEQGVFSDTMWKLADKLGPLTDEEWAENCRRRKEEDAKLGSVKPTELEAPQLDLSNAKFASTRAAVLMFCNELTNKHAKRKPLLLVLAGGVGNGKKTLARLVYVELVNNGRVARATPWHNIVGDRDSRREAASYRGVLIIEDFFMGSANDFLNKREGVAHELRAIIADRERGHLPTIVTTPHKGSEINKVCPMLRAAIKRACPNDKYIELMHTIPQYDDMEQEKEAETDCFD